MQNAILTLELGPNITFWLSESYFNIRIWPISHFDIRISNLTFEFGPNISFWHSNSNFNIRIRAEYLILTFKILFWLSNLWQISHFDIRNPILSFSSGRISHFDIRNHILTLKLGPNITFWYLKSYIHIRIRLQNLGQISNYPILTFEIGRIIAFRRLISYFVIWIGPNIAISIITFEFGPNISFWHSKSCFDCRMHDKYLILSFEILFCHSIRAEYRILTFVIIFWHSNWGRISQFDIRNPIFTFEHGPNIEVWHSKSYFDFGIRADYCILTFDILFCHLNWGKYSILPFKILFWHSNWGLISHFDILILTEYRILAFWFEFGCRISHFDIRSAILTVELGPNIKFWHSKSYFDFRIWAD